VRDVVTNVSYHLPVCCDANHVTAPVFVICDDCKNVAELIDAGHNSSQENILKRSGFVPERPIIEIHGCCGDCENA